jgi:O-methyltransferase involved in polyketide biosynthesis
MGNRDPRKMALQIAAHRASETRLPEDERVFRDPYAEFLLPDEMRAGLDDLDEIRAAISRYEQMMPGVCGRRRRTAAVWHRGRKS